MKKHREVKIHCPKCAWEPQQSSRWWCAPLGVGCGCSWNTFDTGGVCPDCGKAWQDTVCLACHRRSAHRAWYHDFVTEIVEVEAEAALPERGGGGSLHGSQHAGCSKTRARDRRRRLTSGKSLLVRL